MERKTKIEMYTEIKALLTDKDQIAFIENEIELVKRKNSKKTLTATQKANVEFKDEILVTLSTDNPMTIKEIQSANEVLADLSNQRVSALLTQLIEVNKVERVIEKRVSKFLLKED
jgi:hypothetical protein